MSAEINPGWEHKYLQVLNSEYIKELEHDLNSAFVQFLHNLEMHHLITSEQSERSQWKVRLVIPRTVRRVINMIKGSIKYTTDDWSVATWLDMGMDDKADGDNYDDLFRSWLRENTEIFNNE